MNRYQLGVWQQVNRYRLGVWQSAEPISVGRLAVYRRHKSEVLRANIEQVNVRKNWITSICFNYAWTKSARHATDYRLDPDAPGF